MKVIDSFLFTHEHDLLEVRLRTLWPVVDKFILVEGDHNFANKPKEMKFDAKRFEWAKEKLVHLQHIGKFIDYEGVINVPGELFVEHQHRQYLYETALTYGEGRDILLLSDVDEIPSREIIEKLKEGFISPTLLKQDFYYYNVKCHRGMRWNGTVAFHCDDEYVDIGNMRGTRNLMPFFEKNTGWHLAHFFDSDGIREKLLHSSHQAYNDPVFYDKEHLEKCVKENTNFIGKPDGSIKPEPLPEYLLEQLRKFPIFMGEEWR